MALSRPEFTWPCSLKPRPTKLRAAAYGAQVWTENCTQKNAIGSIRRCWGCVDVIGVVTELMVRWPLDHTTLLRLKPAYVSTNSTPLGCIPSLTTFTVNSVQTLKAQAIELNKASLDVYAAIFACPEYASEIGTEGTWYGARFSTEFCTRGCHWIPRMFA
jgi:hypothetical protein